MGEGCSRVGALDQFPAASTARLCLPAPGCAVGTQAGLKIWDTSRQLGLDQAVETMRSLDSGPSLAQCESWAAYVLPLGLLPV